MPLPPGFYDLGPDHAALLLHTGREGLAASVGHDLTLEIARWSAKLTVETDVTACHVRVSADLGSVVVLEGHGGAMPLTEGNRRDIVKNARKALGVDRRPEAVFSSTAITGSWSAAVIEGTLTLNGTSAALELTLEETGPGSYRVSGAVTQTAFGITPYSAMLGALRLRDDVQIEVDIAFEG